MGIEVNERGSIMNISEIKSAVDQGFTVYWANEGYTVTKDSKGQYFIKHISGHCIGLTNLRGDKLNGNPEEFYFA